MNPRAKREMRFFRKLLVESFHRITHGQGSLDRAQGVIFLFYRRVEPGHNRITHELVNGALVGQYGVRHGSQVAV